MPNIQVTRPEFEAYWINRHRRKRRLDTLQNLLFGHGENGFLFGNFGELDELFTTSVGPTNVAANDDPVGLALDDHGWGSQTLAQIVAAQTQRTTNPGPEFVTATDITATGVSLAVVSGDIEATALDGTADRAEWTVSGLTIGRTYKAVVRAKRGVVGGASQVLGSWTWGTIPLTNISTTEFVDYTFYVVATATSGVTRVYAANAGATGDSVIVDSVSVKEVPGNHALQATAANRPLWKANAGKPYLAFDGTNDGLIPPFKPMASGSGLTMAAAFNNTSGAVVSTMMGSGSGSGRAGLQLQTDGSIIVAWGTQVGRNGGVVDIRNQNHVLVVTGEASSRDVWLDGTDITASFNAASGTPSGITGSLAIGARQGSDGGALDFPMAGNIPAALALNHRVTPAEIARITSDFQRTF